MLNTLTMAKDNKNIINPDDFFNGKSLLYPEIKNPEQTEENNTKLQSYETTNVATEEPTKGDTNIESVKPTELATNSSLKLRLQLYSYKQSKDDLKKGRTTATNVEINDEIKRAIKELTDVFTDSNILIANDTDRTLKEVVNNALHDS